MPHIVFNGKINLEEISKKFTPIFVKSNTLIKIKEVFLNSKKHTALFSTVVIDESHKEFFIEVSTNKEKTTVRLFPLTDPDKTPSVKKAMVLISLLIKTEYSELQITKTNLQEYLDQTKSPW